MKIMWEVVTYWTRSPLAAGNGHTLWRNTNQDGKRVYVVNYNYPGRIACEPSVNPNQCPTSRKRAIDQAKADLRHQHYNTP
jgi:hypothetical protein